MIFNNRVIIPVLSIIVPVWNTAEDTLKRALTPFFENKDSRIELVLVDDGSEKTIADYLDILQSSFDFKLIHQANRGQNAARQKGIEVAKGTYVGFLDSDDCLDWGSLQNVISIIEQSESDIITFNGKYVDKNGKDVGSIRCLGNNFVDRKVYVRTCAELWLQVFRRDFLLKHGGLFTPEGICIGEDLASVLPLAIKAKKIKQVDFPVYRYYQQENGSVMHSSSCMTRMTILKAFNHIMSTLSESERQKFHDEIEWQAINHLLNYETRAQLKYGFSGLSNVHALYAWVNDYFPNWSSNRYISMEEKRQGLPLKLALHKHYYIIMLYQCVFRNFLKLYQQIKKG